MRPCLPLLEETGFVPSKKFADGAEIQCYARLIAERFGSDPTWVKTLGPGWQSKRITETGFVANGRQYPVDCMIFASGFEVTSDLDRRWSIDVFQGRDNLSIYDHWKRGPVTLHGTMTHGFPNQFYIGYIQGGLNATVTEQFGQQGYHSAYIISEALKRGLSAVEPTQEAQDDYVRRFKELEIDMSEFQGSCTRGYFNNEGEAKANWALFRSWGYGWEAFQAMLKDWRDKGDLAGMKQE